MTVKFADLEIGKIYSLKHLLLWRSIAFNILLTKVHEFKEIELSGFSYLTFDLKHRYMSADDFEYYDCTKLS